MARANREMRRFQAGVRSLQSDLGAVLADLEQIALSGREVGMEQARARFEDVRSRLGDLVGESISEPAAAVQRCIARHPVASIASAFAAGLAAWMMLAGSGGNARSAARRW